MESILWFYHFSPLCIRFFPSVLIWFGFVLFTELALNTLGEEKNRPSCPWSLALPLRSVGQGVRVAGAQMKPCHGPVLSEMEPHAVVLWPGHKDNPWPQASKSSSPVYTGLSPRETECLVTLLESRLLRSRTWGNKCRRAFSAFTERFSLNQFYFITTVFHV